MENFVVDLEKVVGISKEGFRYYFFHSLMDVGVIVEKAAACPGSCQGCIFENSRNCAMWFECSANRIYVFNHESIFYVPDK